ncbi:hypothetical protein Ancab_002510 [Ancistrocladus abbreviatus]
MRSWSSTEVSHKRLVWLRCFGVPLQLWDLFFFAELARLWGSFVTVDECTKRRDSFAMARGLILTSEARPALEAVRVKVSDHTFSIKVVEETGGDRVWQGSDMLCEELEAAGKSGSIFEGQSKTLNRVPATPDGDASVYFEARLDRDHTHVTRRARGMDLAQTEAERREESSSAFSEEGETEPPRGSLCHLKRIIAGGHFGHVRRDRPASDGAALLGDNGLDNVCSPEEGGRKKRSVGPKEKKSIGLSLKHFLKKPRRKLHPKQRKTLKPQEIDVPPSCAVGDGGDSPPASSVARMTSSKHSGSTTSWSCEMGNKGTSPPLNNAAPSKSMTSDSTSAAEIWEVGKALGTKFAGHKSEVTNRLLEMKLRENRAREKPKKMKTAARPEESSIVLK